MAPDCRGGSGSPTGHLVAGNKLGPVSLLLPCARRTRPKLMAQSQAHRGAGSSLISSQRPRLTEACKVAPAPGECATKPPGCWIRPGMWMGSRSQLSSVTGSPAAVAVCNAACGIAVWFIAQPRWPGLDDASPATLTSVRWRAGR